MCGGGGGRFLTRALKLDVVGQRKMEMRRACNGLVEGERERATLSMEVALC